MGDSHDRIRNKVIFLGGKLVPIIIRLVGIIQEWTARLELFGLLGRAVECCLEEVGSLFRKVGFDSRLRPA